MDILVTYDIADTDAKGASRLRRIASICEKYGQRVQLSVFECRLSKTKFTRLLIELEDIIDKKLDTVMIYQFHGEINEAKVTLGRVEEHQVGKPWVV